MMDDNKERRQDYWDMKQAIALLQKDVHYIKEAIDGNHHDFKEHIQSAIPYRDKVANIMVIEKSLDTHIVQDRWLFGILCTMQVAILTKIMGTW